MVLTAPIVALGGAVVLTLLALQVSLGMRWIKFKGRTHWKVHKAVGFTVLGLGVAHAVAALVYLGFIPGAS